MSWAALANDQWVSYKDLQDAVDTGVFVLRTGQTIPTPTSDREAERDGIITWLWAEIDTTGWVGVVPNNQWVQKSWIKPVTVPVPTDEILDLGSPSQLFFNAVDSQIYYLESDTMGNVPTVIDGGIGMLDPVTAETYSDITYYAIGTGSQTGVLNTANNTIYSQGYNSSGLVMFNCTSKTFSTILYGGSSSSDRGSVYLVGTRIYASYGAIQGFVVVDTTTNTRLADFVPPGAIDGGYVDFFMIQAPGSTVWIYLSNSTTEPVRADLYNLADVYAGGTPVPIASITNLSTVQNRVGRYGITNVQFDFDGDKMWFTASGEKVIRAISNSSRTVVHNIGITSSFPYLYLGILLHPQTNNVYASGSFGDNTDDSASPITYLLDTVAGTIFQTYPGVSFRNNFVYAPTTDKSYGTSPGRYVYSVPNTGYSTDGSILVY